jgi:hypothetical protein
VAATPGVLGAFGVRPRIGRLFTLEDEASRRTVVVLSHGYWQGRFGGSPEVVGQRLTVDGEIATILAVGPGDPLTLLATALRMTSAGALASALPARRATRVDPAVTLRCE